MKKKSAEKIETMAKNKPRFLMGFAAGAVGGLAGAAAMVAMERFSSPQTGGALPLREAEPGPPDRMQRTNAGGPRIHWGVGALAGGVYGMVAEVWPQVTEGNGAAFGLVLDAATHESPTREGGLLSLLHEQRPFARTGEVTTHAAYGITAEFVRKHVRSWLESREKKHRREATRSARHTVNLTLPA